MAFRPTERGIQDLIRVEPFTLFDLTDNCRYFFYVEAPKTKSSPLKGRDWKEALKGNSQMTKRETVRAPLHCQKCTPIVKQMVFTASPKQPILLHRQAAGLFCICRLLSWRVTTTWYHSDSGLEQRCHLAAWPYRRPYRADTTNTRLSLPNVIPISRLMKAVNATDYQHEQQLPPVIRISFTRKVHRIIHFIIAVTVIG